MLVYSIQLQCYVDMHIDRLQLAINYDVLWCTFVSFNISMSLIANTHCDNRDIFTTVMLAFRPSPKLKAMDSIPPPVSVSAT